MACDRFRRYACTTASWSIVLPAFYVHVWRRAEYPILDRNVRRVHWAEIRRAPSKSTLPASWRDYQAYSAFFRAIVARTGLHWRSVDRGLWVLGSRGRGRAGASGRQCRGAVATRPDPPLHRDGLLPIPDRILERACLRVAETAQPMPFKHRGIRITRDLVRVTLELLNAAPGRTLAQNCRNDTRERTPDGLYRRIKERLGSDLRTANIVSDVLQQAGIVEVLAVISPGTGRTVNGTKLLEEWWW